MTWKTRRLGKPAAFLLLATERSPSTKGRPSPVDGMRRRAWGAVQAEAVGVSAMLDINASTIHDAGRARGTLETGQGTAPHPTNPRRWPGDVLGALARGPRRCRSLDG